MRKYIICYGRSGVKINFECYISAHNEGEAISLFEIYKKNIYKKDDIHSVQEYEEPVFLTERDIMRRAR